MMKLRVVSGIVIAGIVIPLCLLGDIYFEIFSCILGILALKEVIDLKGHHEKLPIIIQIISYLSLILVVLSHYLNISSIKALEIVFLSLSIPCLIYKKSYNSFTSFYLMGWIFLFGIVFNNLIVLRNSDLGLYKLIYLGSIPIVTDIFAMLIGSFIGKHKLIPSISPNKTIEGSIGGSIVATIVSSIFYFITIKEISLVQIILVTLLLSVIGQISDLLFSKVKRENKLKDFSNLIPGHGGILDRFDSLMLVTITYGILFL